MRMKASTIVYAILVILLLTAGVAAVLSRMNAPSATEMALGRGLVPGMPLADATALLTRLGVSFTVDSAADRTMIVKYGRKSSSDNRTSQVTEQHIVFDAQGRLQNQITVSEFRSE